MRARSAHPQLRNTGLVLREIRHRALEEQLLKTEFTLEDVSFCKSHRLFEVPRRKHLSIKYLVAQSRDVFGKCIDHCVSERFAILRPVLSAFLDVIGSILNKA